MAFYRFEIGPVMEDGTRTASVPALGVSAGVPARATAEEAVSALAPAAMEAGLEHARRTGLVPRGSAAVPEGGCAVLAEIRIEEALAAMSPGTARRNVSLPAWLDARLRAAGIDGSRLFQDAAAAKLAELEAEAMGRKIGSPEELEAACAPGVLDAYIDMRLGREAAGGKKG